MTASLTSILLCCLIALFVLQISIYYNRNGFNETHSVEWRRTQGECRCGTTMTTSFNCYPRAFAGRSTTNATADSLRCGECFSCISMSLASGERRKSEMVFALSSDHTAMNKLLVLIASVHKYYPSTKILLYDNEIGSDLLQKRLISVRNVIVIPAEVATQHPSDEADKFQWNACFLWDALTRYRTVLWLNDDLEFLSRNLDEILNKTTSPITAIGREYTTDIRKHGFVPYFPGTVTPRNYTMLLLRTGAGKTFQWITKCASEPSRHCWDCRASDGEAVDCMPSLLARLSVDTRVEYRPMPTNSVQHQRWEPTTCDARCIAYTFIAIILFLFIAIAVVLIMFSRATNKFK